MSTVRTALIPAGGWGTRFLPTTKSVPKELLPVGNKPVILHVVEEAVSAGITDIVIVTSGRKQEIELLFSGDAELSDVLRRKGKERIADEIDALPSMANFSFVHARPPDGNGSALLAAAHLLRDKDFVVLWGDEMVLADDRSRTAQCLDAFESCGLPVVCAMEIADPKRRACYGMVDFKKKTEQGSVRRVRRIVEKPAMGNEPSPFAALGAYVCTPEVLSVAKRTPLGACDELWMTDILNRVATRGGLAARVVEGCHYLDCGNPFEYQASQLKFAYAHCSDKAAFAQAMAGCLETMAG